MKRLALGFFVIVLFITSCTNPMDRPLNSKDFPKIKETINSDTAFSKMKKKFIIDNLTNELNIVTLGKALKVDKSKFPTFKKEISDLSKEFDSTYAAKLKIKKDNEILNNFAKLTDAYAVPIDKYHGYLFMNLKFNNPFTKPVLYVIIEYKYVDKYDTEYFDSKTKITDKVAGNFKTETKLVSEENYNDVSEFLATKLPENKKENRKYLMKNLKVKTLGIVFKDKTEIFHEDVDWKYLDN
jgi:hypothetical protein